MSVYISMLTVDTNLFCNRGRILKLLTIRDIVIIIKESRISISCYIKLLRELYKSVVLLQSRGRSCILISAKEDDIVSYIILCF